MSTNNENELLHGLYRVLGALEQCLEQPMTMQARENLKLTHAALAVAVLQQEQALERIRCLSEAAVMMKDVEAILDAQAPARAPGEPPTLTVIPTLTKAQRAMAAMAADARAEKLPLHDFFPDL